MSARIAIVNYGMGNLFSIRQACARVGADAFVTDRPAELEAADAVVLPGVGAFGTAMARLEDRGLADALRKIVEARKPLLGVCLGMQLLMTESFEFGRHRGLGVLKGAVVRLDDPVEDGRRLPVPHVGWSRLERPREAEWDGTLLQGVEETTSFYFVHSYCIPEASAARVLSYTRYGHVRFVSTLAAGAVFACQYHPERSGERGLRVYRNLVAAATGSASGGDRPAADATKEASS